MGLTWGWTPHPKTLTAYHTAIPVYIPLKQVSTTHTKRLPTLTKRGGPPLPQNAYRLPYSNFNVFTTKTGKHDAYQTPTDAHHEGVNPPIPKTLTAYHIIFNVFTSKTGQLDDQTLADVYHEAVAPPTPINAYRLQYRNCNVLTS